MTMAKTDNSGGNDFNYKKHDDYEDIVMESNFTL